MPPALPIPLKPRAAGWGKWHTPDHGPTISCCASNIISGWGPGAGTSKQITHFFFKLEQCVPKNPDSRTRLSGFKTQLCHSGAVGPSENDFTSPCFSFPSVKWGE